MSVKHWKLGWKRCDCVKCDHALTVEQTAEDCGWVTWGDHKDEVARLKADFYQASDERADYAKDVAKLKAEVERLTQEYSDATNHYNKLHNDLEAEVEHLRKFNDEALAHIAKEERKSRERLDMAQAEIERLRKAGDAVSLCLEAYLYCIPYEGPMTIQCLEAWNAAKEGKQS